ncbi:phage tail protein [Vibrio scophthalmi]|uniref:Putative phage tail protein n=1 Tax=Vibrio scophthalmi LMG 19158 TaxID=870967 RepID=F9RLU4_9VIBR|nr:phage tail protein [Vibrio scophthalmi]EGU38644.1 putative phage tail protein [Vibrio scophthalmi LMG 19158]
MSLVITNAGIAASIQAAELGIQYKITHISIGSEGYVPTASQTELRNEIQRKVITKGEQISLGQLHFETVWDGREEFEGKELGYWLEDGTLFAVDSRNGEVITYKRADTVVTEAVELNLSASSLTNITVELMGSPLATERVAGIAKIATNEQVEAGTEDHAFLTVKKLVYSLGVTHVIEKLVSTLWQPLIDKMWLPLAELIYPVGCPIPYPGGEAPHGFMAYIGQPFDKTVFVKLGERYPSGVMPDLRKSYIRGLGNGETVLSRKTQSVQPLGFQSDPHTHGTNATAYGTIRNGYERTTGYPEYRSSASVYSATVTGRITGTGDETNPNSIRFLFITRAA